MKKSILTLMIMAVGYTAFSQSTLGIKGSINSYTITTDNPSVGNYTFSKFKSDAKAGFDAGLFARLGNKIYLQPELLYCERNSQTSFVSSTNETGIQKLSLKTIQVPVLLGLKLLDLKVASIRVFSGPAMSYVLPSSNVKVNNITSGLFDTKNYKNNIWDWQLGAGVDISKFVFDVRYEWGLTNVSSGGGVTNIGFVNKGNLLTFSVGIKIL